MAVRDNEAGAASVGIAVAHNQLAAFLISAAICGVAGGIYYLSVLYVDPTGAFDIDWQIRILFVVIVGGVGTLEGPIVGTLLYFGLRELFRDAGDLFLIFQGATAMIVMLLHPAASGDSSRPAPVGGCFRSGGPWRRRCWLSDAGARRDEKFAEPLL